MMTKNFVLIKKRSLQKHFQKTFRFFLKHMFGLLVRLLSFVTSDQDHETSPMSSTYKMNLKKGSNNFAVRYYLGTSTRRRQEYHGARLIDMTRLSGERE